MFLGHIRPVTIQKFTEAEQGGILDLPDPLPGNMESCADILQCLLRGAVEAESVFENFPLTGLQPVHE